MLANDFCLGIIFYTLVPDFVLVPLLSFSLTVLFIFVVRKLEFHVPINAYFQLMFCHPFPINRTINPSNNQSIDQFCSTKYLELHLVTTRKRKLFMLYTLFQNGHYFSGLLCAFKLALVASFLNSIYKRIFSLERGNKG